MKLLILANNLKWRSWDKKITQLKEWWLPEITLEITLEQVSFSKIPFVVYEKKNGVELSGVEHDWFDRNISKPALERGFDCVMFCIPPDQWKSPIIEGWNTYNNHGIHEIQIKSKENARYDFYGKKYDGDQWFNLARHELSHAIYRSRGITDNTHKWWESGNLSEVKKELSSGFMSHPIVLGFQRLLKPPKKYRYFNHAEVEGLQPTIVQMLDDARHIAGIPFVLNSTLRSPEKNEQVGGVKDSAHTKGLAVDIRCRNSNERFLIKKALYTVGFKRIGHGKTFIHADIDDTKPQNVEWDY